MARRFYPAVLEKGAKGTFGIWFPDFPDCVAAGRSQEEAIQKAEHALAVAVEALAEADQPLPEPTPFEAIVLPKGCRFVANLAVGVEPPNPSERVNIYLPKRLLARADQMAAELGMSRSSFFGLAISSIAGLSYAYPDIAALRRKVAKLGEEEKAEGAKAPAKRR
jgi:predicted RNase H-like HicB family nuclease